MNKYKTVTSILALLLLFTGCINLSVLQEYSGSSVEGVQKFQEIGFSFREICESNCEHQANADGEAIQNRLSNNYRPIKMTPDCECGQFEKADSAFGKIYFATLQYLEGLRAFSSDDRLVFKYDTLANALVETNLLGVKKEDINVFNKLVTLTTKLVVDVKRRNDLQKIIEKANGPFQQLVSKLKYAVDVPLSMALETNIDQEYNYYKAVVFYQQELSLKDKLELEQQFKAERDKINRKLNLLKEYSKLLDGVKKGHQSIYDNREKIHKEELGELIGGYITEVRQLKTTFDNLKTIN